jgi:hypothetical protein
MYVRARIEAMRFESKRDWWIVALLRGVPILVLAAIVIVSWTKNERDLHGPAVGVLLLIVFELFFCESILRSTYYTIEGGMVIIRSSLLRWRIPIADIRSITPTRNPLSSPAMSLDRLLIRYGTKQIMVSPAEKQRFIEALRAVNPAIST